MKILPLNWIKSGSFLKIPNKFWEVQVMTYDHWTSYFELYTDFTRKCDHAGFKFRFELCGFYLGVDIYDSRHWDDDNEEWEKQ